MQFNKCSTVKMLRIQSFYWDFIKNHPKFSLFHNYLYSSSKARRIDDCSLIALRKLARIMQFCNWPKKSFAKFQKFLGIREVPPRTPYLADPLQSSTRTKVLAAPMVGYISQPPENTMDCGICLTRTGRLGREK